MSKETTTVTYDDLIAGIRRIGYDVRQAPRVDTVRGPTVVIDDGVSITGGPNPPASVLLSDTVAGDVGPRTLPVPLPDFGPGRLVRDDAACGWRFEPEVR